jgi:hypothetical protein
MGLLSTQVPNLFPHDARLPLQAVLSALQNTLLSVDGVSASNVAAQAYAWVRDLAARKDAGEFVGPIIIDVRIDAPRFVDSPLLPLPPKKELRLPEGYRYQHALLARDTVCYQGTFPTDDQSAATLAQWAIYLFTALGADQEDALAYAYDWLLCLRSRGQALDVARVSSQPGADSTADGTPPDNPLSNESEKPVPEPTPEEAPRATEKLPDTKAPPEDPDKRAAFNRLSGKQCASVAGLKRSLTRTHNMPWEEYCSRFGLDPDSGLDSSAAPRQPTLTDAIPAEDPPQGPGAPALQQPSAEGDGQQMTLADAGCELPPPEQQMPTTSSPTPDLPPQWFQQPQAQPQPQAQQPQQQQAQPQSQAQQPQQQQAQPQAQAQPQSPRLVRAQQLGGPVTLWIMPLNRLPTMSPDDLRQWADAGQMAKLAEQEALNQLSVQDIADAKGFQKGEQTVQRLFGEMLTQNPYVMVLANGYDWVLDKHSIATILSRAVQIVQFDRSGTPVTTVL